MSSPIRHMRETDAARAARTSAKSTLLSVDEFDLSLTLLSGQFFRYYPAKSSARDAAVPRYLLITEDRIITVAQTHDKKQVSFQGADTAFITNLFQITPTYQAQMTRLRKDPVLLPIIEKYPGLRVMRQNLHETIIGFICSSQSNIPKIKLNLHMLAHTCGTVDGEHAHLPRAGTVLSHDAVRAARTGYRAKYIVATNALLTPKLLDEIQTASYAKSHELLCSLPGIGPKIADCVCLFALGHGEAFPVDVHILRAMKQLFPKQRFADEKGMKQFAQQRWGKDAGLAQQFIYQWARDTANTRSTKKTNTRKISVVRTISVARNKSAMRKMIVKRKLPNSKAKQ